MHSDRLEYIRTFLAKSNLDAMFITYPSNIFYFSDFRSLTYNEREAYVLISKSHAYILTSKLYLDDIKRNAKNFTIKEISSETPLKKILSDIILADRFTSIGFEEHNLTYHEYQLIEPIMPKFIPGN